MSLVRAASGRASHDCLQRDRRPSDRSWSALHYVADSTMWRSALAHHKWVETSARHWQIPDMGDSRELDDVVARQHGAFSRRQAHEAGFDKDAILRRVGRGVWTRLDESVLAVRSSPPTWEQSLWASVLSRPQSVLSHETAARLIGLSGFSKTRPVLLVPRGSNTRSPLARVFESDQYDRIATTRVEGLPITTTPETILLLARTSPAARLEEVFDEALISGRLDLIAMSKTIDREAGRRTPGTPLLRRLISSRRPRAPSHAAGFLEVLLQRILNDSRFPACTSEFPFNLDGVPARVDVFVPSARLVIEADGRNWHARWQDFESDRRRDNALACRGIQVLRFTYEMLTKEADRCLEQAIATVLVRAA